MEELTSQWTIPSQKPLARKRGKASKLTLQFIKQKVKKYLLEFIKHKNQKERKRLRSVTVVKQGPSSYADCQTYLASWTEGSMKDQPAAWW